MSLLVQINSTPELLLSDDGTSTSEGRAWRAAIRAVQFTDRIASPIKPLYVPPRMTLRVTSVGVLDLDDLIGKTAQAWQGSGPVFAGYTSILKGRVSERSSQSEATTTLIIEPTLDNPSATYTNDTSSRLSALAEAIATQEAIAYDFDDWKAESDPEMGTAAIEVPAPAADLIAQAAFEDFNDLAIQDDKLTVLTRRPAAPGTQIHIYAAPDARVEIDPFQETVNRLSLVFPDEIRIYEDSTSIGKIGVREQTVQARFIPKSAANLWAARYLHRYAATQVWVSVELGGCWPPGSQFRARWAKPETLHRQYVTDQRYQVRQATYRPADDTTQVRAWRVTTDPGTLQPLTPTRTVDTPGPALSGLKPDLSEAPHQPNLESVGNSGFRLYSGAGEDAQKDGAFLQIQLQYSLNSPYSWLNRREVTTWGDQYTFTVLLPGYYRVRWRNGDVLGNHSPWSAWAIQQITKPLNSDNAGVVSNVLTRTSTGYQWAGAVFNPGNTGSLGQYLQKTSMGYQWATIPTYTSFSPSNTGTANQVLTKTSTGYQWAGAAFNPANTGTANQVLTKTSTGYQWANSVIGFQPSNTGTAGQVLQKTATGYQWADKTSQFKLSAVTSELTSSQLSLNDDLLVADESVTGKPNKRISVSNFKIAVGFSPISAGTQGQYLRKGSGATYYWDTKSPSSFDLYDDVTVRQTVLNTGDRLLIADTSAPGNPMEFVTVGTLETRIGFQPSNTGTTGQVLTKNNYGYQWTGAAFKPSNTGTTGQLLEKTATGYQWAGAAFKPGNSEDATAGDVLTKTATHYGWASVRDFRPSNAGTVGQYLERTNTGFQWASVDEFSPSNTGSTGQILTKTATGYQWAAAPSGTFNPENTGSNGQVLEKTNSGYRWAGAAFEPLNAGTAGQVLQRDTTGVSYRWQTMNGFNPSNTGSTGQVLVKTSSGYNWAGTTVFNPENTGSNGQVLEKTNSGYRWAGAAFEPLNAGTAGQVLQRDTTGVSYRWQTMNGFNPSNTGSTGQVLVKTSSGYNWAGTTVFNPENTGSNGQVLEKTNSGYRWAGAAFEPLNAGTAGQVLQRDTTGVSYRWQTMNGFNPSNTGSTGQVLVKTSSGYNWAGTTVFNPENTGSNGQVLEKTNSGYRWAGAAFEPLNAGTAGQVLQRDTTGVSYRWQTISEFNPSNTGSNGQVLTKTSTGYQWAGAAFNPASDGAAGRFLQKTATGMDWQDLPIFDLYDDVPIQLASANIAGVDRLLIADVDASGASKFITVSSLQSFFNAGVFSPGNTGSSGQFLKKTGSGASDYEWRGALEFIPMAGGDGTGEFLERTSTGYEWTAIDEFSPGNTGSTGQILTKTATGYQWAAAPSGTFAPSNTGSIGQVLTKTATGYQWATAPSGTFAPSNTGSTGDFLEKTSSGYQWASVDEFSPGNTGSTGQYLQKTSSGYQWATIPTYTSFSPSNTGSTNDILTKTATGYQWAAPASVDEFSPSNTGSTGQYLEKTSSGYQWATIPTYTSFSPSNSGSTNDILTKTATGYQWAAPASVDEFSPSNTGSAGQVLTKTSSAYQWQDLPDAEDPTWSSQLTVTSSNQTLISSAAAGATYDLFFTASKSGLDSGQTFLGGFSFAWDLLPSGTNRYFPEFAGRVAGSNNGIFDGNEALLFIKSGSTLSVRFNGTAWSGVTLRISWTRRQQPA